MGRVRYTEIGEKEKFREILIVEEEIRLALINRTMDMAYKAW